MLDQRLVTHDDVKWTGKLDNKDWVEARLKVAHEQDGELILILSASLVLPRKHSFSLIYRGRRIRGLCVNGSPHKNGGCVDNLRIPMGVMHKHAYRDECADGWAYIPNDITTDELKPSFLQFCAECGIEFKGGWFALPTSRGASSDRKLGMDI